MAANRNNDMKKEKNINDSLIAVEPRISGSTFMKMEAFKRMQSGEKVTHKSMTPDEYLHIENGGSKVLTEDGYDFTESFWFRNIAYYEHGWSLYCH